MIPFRLETFLQRYFFFFVIAIPAINYCQSVCLFCQSVRFQYILFGVSIYFSPFGHHRLTQILYYISERSDSSPPLMPKDMHFMLNHGGLSNFVVSTSEARPVRVESEGRRDHPRACSRGLSHAFRFTDAIEAAASDYETFFFLSQRHAPIPPEAPPTPGTGNHLTLPGKVPPSTTSPSAWRDIGRY